MSKLYRDYQKNKSVKIIASQLRAEIKELKRGFHADWKQWMRLSKDVMRLAAV
jgi:hypothetical protein